MAGKESRQCPHFDTNDGVCGCPEFWRPAQRSQNDRPSSLLHEALSAPYSQSASNRQVSSSVNSIPLPERKKSLSVTPAPPGPPKETCFFWYHGSCQRGGDCERPHEAHPTWPIPPPPGFYHYQPCTLPLCPLQSDLAASGKPQECQRRHRTMDGQLDGAAFSRARTAGESSNDNDSNTDTDMNETVENTYVISEERCSSASPGSAGRGDAEGAVQTDEVKAHEMGRSGSDESDYVDLSRLLSPPSTPLVRRETLLSISHPGTLSKSRHSPTTKSPKCSNNSRKLKKISTPELDNVVSLFKRPRKMSQWDIKPPSFGLEGQPSESAASYLTALHGFLPYPSTRLTAANKNNAEHVPVPFDPPKGPRSLDTLPPICFFYYHEGYCRPNNGRRCDYVHDMDTPQQTVSLPHGIDSHDPSYSLPLCPVRIRRATLVKHAQNLFAPDSQPEVKHKPLTSSRIDKSPLFGTPDSSPRDLIISVRGRPPRGMLGQPLPQLTGLARERFKEQKYRIEQVQAKGGIGLAEAASVVDAVHQRQRQKQVKRKKRRVKKRALVSVAEEFQLLKVDQESCQQGSDNHSGTWITQQPLPSLSLKESTPNPAVTVPVGDSQGNRRQRNQNQVPYQRLEGSRLREAMENDDLRRSTDKDYAQTNTLWALPGFSSLQQAPHQPWFDGGNQVSNGRRASEFVRTGHQNLGKGLPLTTSPPRRPSQQVLPYEYSQDALGLTSEERRAGVVREQTTRREAHNRSLLIETEEEVIAEEAVTHLAATAAAHEVLREAGHEVVGRRMRCQRCLEMKGKCDRGRPCSRCIAAGIDPRNCIDRDANHDRNGQCQNNVVHAQSMVDDQLPEGDQRLEWDTDLVRRLFGEIEY